MRVEPATPGAPPTADAPASRSRGDARPVLVGHERVPVRYRRYAETAGLQAHTNTRQFRTPYPQEWPAHWFKVPDVTYRDRMRITGTRRDLVLFAAPSETDDATSGGLSPSVGDASVAAVLEALRAVDPDTLTPREALDRLYDLKKRLG